MKLIFTGKNHLLLILFFKLFIINAIAQEKRNRYDFAQSYIGFSSQIIPGFGTTQILIDSTLTDRKLPYTYQPRIDIGGLHFWGHLDMMASIPLFGGYRINYSNVDYHISTGFSMNIRYYPVNLLKPTRFGLRPFAGIKWSDMRYWQKVEGSERGIQLNKQIVMAETGCAVEHKKYLIDLTVQWMPFNRFSYPVSRTMQGNLKFPPLSFKVGVKYLFDITAVNKKPEVKNETDAYQKFLTEKKKLNSWSVGIGISEVLPVGVSSYKNIPERTFLQNPGPMHIFPEIGFTVYFFRTDLELRLAYRPVWNKQEGYGFIHKTFRHSVSLEAYKFLFDYKGFLPFAGLGFGYNNLHLQEIDNGNVVIQKNEQKLAPLILIGWDIRPTRVEWMIIRSNIRWTPWLSMEIGDTRLQFNDIEINFLQYVVYPGRIKAKKEFKRAVE
jgi:outer membrane protein W